MASTTRSDAWLLMALAISGPEASDIIHAADYLNRAIPTYEEWEHACAALGERGLVAAGTDFPTITESGRALVRSFYDGERGVIEIVPMLAEALRPLPVVGEPLPPPKKEALARGYKAHVDEFDAMLREEGLLE